MPARGRSIRHSTRNKPRLTYGWGVVRCTRLSLLLAILCHGYVVTAVALRGLCAWYAIALTSSPVRGPIYRSSNARTHSHGANENASSMLINTYNHSCPRIYDKHSLCIFINDSLLHSLPFSTRATISKLLHHCQRGRSDKSCCRLLTVSESPHNCTALSFS
jgi:hypothetical protein